MADALTFDDLLPPEQKRAAAPTAAVPQVRGGLTFDDLIEGAPRPSTTAADAGQPISGEVPRETTAGEFAGGSLLDLARGFIRFPQSVANLGQAVTPWWAEGAAEAITGTDPNAAVDAMFKRGLESAQDLKPSAYVAEQRRGFTERDPETGDVTGLQMPSAETLTGLLAETLPSMPGFLAGGGAAAKGVKGLTKAGPALAQFLGYGATNAGMVAPGQYDQTLAEAMEQLAGREAFTGQPPTPEDITEAERRAQGAAAATALLSFLTGGAGARLAIGKGGRSKSLPAAVARGATADAPFEGAEEGGQSLIGDVALGRDPNYGQALEATLQGGFAGLPIGAVLGGAEYRGQRAREQAGAAPASAGGQAGPDLMRRPPPLGTAPETAQAAPRSTQAPAATQVAPEQGIEALSALVEQLGLPELAPRQPDTPPVPEGLTREALIEAIMAAPTPDARAEAAAMLAAFDQAPEAPAQAPVPQPPLDRDSRFRRPVEPAEPKGPPGPPPAAAGEKVLDPDKAVGGEVDPDKLAYVVHMAPNGKPFQDSKGRPLRKLAWREDTDDLRVWLAVQGGITPEVAREAGVDPATFRGKANVVAPMVPNGVLVRRQEGGMHQDRLREAMQEAGWLPEDADDNDALDLVRQGLDGAEPVYQGAARVRQMMREDQARGEDEAAREPESLSALAAEFGLEPEQMRERMELSEQQQDESEQRKQEIGTALSEMAGGVPFSQRRGGASSDLFGAPQRAAPEAAARPRAESQPDLLPEPTAAERVEGERRRREAGRENVPMREGAGELFAGPRPEQATVPSQTAPEPPSQLRTRTDARQVQPEVPADAPRAETADSRRLGDQLNAALRAQGATRADARFTEVNKAALPDALGRALGSLEAVTDTRVVVVHNDNPDAIDFDGVTLREGVLYVAGNNTRPLLATASHEWLHQLRRDDPAAYQALEDEVRRQGRIPEWMQTAREQGVPESQAVEELTADAVGDALTDPAFLNRLVQENPGRFRAMVESFLRWIDTMLDRWRTLGSSEYLTDVESFRDVLADVLANDTKRVIREAVRDGTVQPTDAFRGVTVGELQAIAEAGELQVGRSFEGEAGISASVIGDGRFAQYGEGVGIIAPASVTSESGRAREVLIDDDTDPRSLRYVVDGEIVGFDEMARRVGEREAEPAANEFDVAMFSRRRDVTQTPEFKRWSRGAQVIEPDALWTSEYDGGPAVFRMFHGTTADVDAFDRARANQESDFGAGFYFSNTAEDVESNYSRVGPDLENKIQREAERIASETDREYDDPEVVSEARAKWVQHEGSTMQVFVRVLNPAIVGGPHDTRLTYEENYDEETDSYDEPAGTLIGFAEALRQEASRYDDGDVETAIASIMEDAYDGDVPLSNVIEKLKADEKFGYFTDENGDLASNEILRLALARAGFDGVVDYTVDQKFGSQRRIGKAMQGMNEGTVHVVAFRPEQIKSATGNRGTFDPADARIAFSRRRDTATPDMFGNEPIETDSARVRRAFQYRSRMLSRVAADTPQGAPFQDERGNFELSRDTALRFLQNKMLPLLRAQQRGGHANLPSMSSVTLDEAMNAYWLENAMHGKVKEQNDYVQQKMIEPMQQRMREWGISMPMLEDFLLARVAKEVNEHVARINKAMADGGSGITTAKAAAILAGTEAGVFSGKKLDPAVRARYDSLARIIDAMTERSLSLLVKSGRITQALADALRQRYPHFVPLRGKMTDIGPQGGGRSSRAPIKRRLGRGEDNLPVNIVAEVVGDLQRAIMDAEIAKVHQAFVRFAVANPMPDLFTVEPVDLEFKFSEATGQAYVGVRNRAEDADHTLVVKFDGEPVRVRFNMETQQGRALNDAMLNATPEDLTALVRTAGVLNRHLSAVLTRYNPAFAPVNMTRDAIFGMVAITAEHGPAVAAETAARYPAAFAAVFARNRNMDRGDANVPDDQKTTADWLAEASQAGMKTGIIYRDTPVNLQRRLTLASTRLMDMAAHGQYIRQGRNVAFRAGRAGRVALEPVMRVGKPIVDAIEDFNDASENAIRLSVYIALRRRGWTQDKAGEYGKGVTINFNRKGKWSNGLNAVYLFYNAAAQGSAAVLRVMRKPGVQAFLGGLAGLQAMMARSMMDDDDEDGITDWDKVPDYVKRTSLVIPVGGGEYYALPMPYGFNLFSYSGGRIMQGFERRDRINAMEGLSEDERRELIETDRPGEKHAAIDLAMAANEAFSPVQLQDGMHSVFGTAMGFVLELASNKNYRGAPIAAENPYARYPEPAALTGRESTPRMYHVMAQLAAKMGGADLDEKIPPAFGFLDIAPEQIEEVVGFLAGGLGSIFSQTGRWWENYQAGNFETLNEAVREAPIVRRFAPPDRAGFAIADHFYGERGELSRKTDVVRERAAADSDPEQVLRQAQARDPTLEGLELDRYKRGMRTGTLKRSAEGLPQLKKQPGSIAKSLTEAEKMARDIGKAMRKLRNESTTYGELITLLGEDSETVTDTFPPLTPDQPAPNAMRVRALDLLRQRRQEIQQKWLREVQAKRARR